MAVVVPFGLCRILKGTENGRAEEPLRAAKKEGDIFQHVFEERTPVLASFFSNMRLGFFPVLRRIFKATLEGVWSNLG